MKFSIIVPVYNVEKYLKKCLNSILSQTYDDFEIIIVNDGSKDNCQAIIDEYAKKDTRIKPYIKPNGGLSDARNYGVKKAIGDYIIFVDSDDYIEKDLLLKLSEVLQDNDIIRFNVTLVDENYSAIRRAKHFETKQNATFKDLFDVELFQPVWCYAYKTAFWRENKLEFAKGKIHEDFGLTPYCTLIARKICLLDYYGYNYLQRAGSIMNGAEKAKKRVYDTLYHYDTLEMAICNLNNVDVANKALSLSYVANNTISMARFLDKTDKKEYIKQLKQRNITKYLLSDTFVRKLKKLIATISLDTYIRFKFR